MSDRQVVALAVAAWLAALLGLPVPRWVGVVAIVLALSLRRPGLLIVGAFALASSLSAAAWRGLEPPSPATVHAHAVLVSDPTEVGHAVRVDLRIGHRRVEAWARGSAAAELREHLAGETVEVAGRLRPVETARGRLAVRHIAARLDVHRLGAWRDGALAMRAANALRRLLEHGMGSLSEPRRALLRGFLIGDDRDIEPPVEADFRSSGLTHLLAVSGQNLAFVLALAAPALRRLELRGRLVASLTVIGFFALVTRAEPSVLRASAMAAIACWSAFAGRPVARIRILALAVTALLIVDPMLSRSVGFQLSVGASLGLLVLAAPLAARLPGPRWLAEPLAVTIAAQAGVAPVLLTTFGGMPLVTPIANLLAVPVAGPLTAWGFAAGALAGLLGGGAAWLLHLPTGVMVGWVAAVARTSARLPLGTLDGRGAIAVVLLAFVVARWRRMTIPIAVALLVLFARPATSTVRGSDVARGAHVWRSGATVLVLDGSVDGAALLDGLHRARVGRIDLVVARRGSKDVAGVLADLRSRIDVTAVAAPVGHHIRDATAVADPVRLRLGGLVVELVPHGGSLDAHL